MFRKSLIQGQFSTCIMQFFQSLSIMPKPPAKRRRVDPDQTQSYSVSRLPDPSCLHRQNPQLNIDTSIWVRHEVSRCLVRIQVYTWNVGLTQQHVRVSTFVFLVFEKLHVNLQPRLISLSPLHIFSTVFPSSFQMHTVYTRLGLHLSFKGIH